MLRLLFATLTLVAVVAFLGACAELQGPRGRVGPMGPEGPQGIQGVAGQDGQDATIPGEWIRDIVVPCPEIEGQFAEVLIVTSQGRVLAHYSDAGKQHLTLVPAGNYMTTDLRACNFSVTIFGIHWAGGEYLF